MTDFNLEMEDDDNSMLTDEAQELLVKNHRVLFKQPANQIFFNRWVNDDIYDIEEDVLPAIEKVLDRVKEKKMVLRGFKYIDIIVRDNYCERTGHPSVDELVGNLNKKLRGYDE